MITTKHIDGVLAILVKRAIEKSESLKFSREEIEDAPDIEMRELFETDEMEVRVSTYGK